MPLRILMDQHVHRAITLGVRARGVDVLTAYQDGSSRLEDPELLARALELERVLFTQDDDFLAIAHQWQADGRPFAGLVFATQLGITIGQCVADLTLLAQVLEPEDMRGRVEYLPL